MFSYFNLDVGVSRCQEGVISMRKVLAGGRKMLLVSGRC